MKTFRLLWFELTALCHLIQTEARDELRIVAIDRFEFGFLVGPDLGVGDARALADFPGRCPERCKHSNAVC